MPERFSHLFEHLPEPLLIVDGDGRIANANEAAADLYRCERDDLVGHLLTELWDASEQDAVQTELARADERGEITLSGAGRRRDGRLFFQEMRLTVDPDDAGRSAFVLLRDLSERQRLEMGLAGLADLARLDEGEGSLSLVAASALKLARRMLAADRAAVCSFQGDETVEWLASYRLEPLIAASANLRPSQIEWVRSAVESGQPELIDRRSPDHQRSALSEAADSLGVASFAIVPLRVGEELTGILGLTWSDDPPELAQDRPLLTAIGRLIGLALANVRLRDSLLARQEALDESEERYRNLFQEAPEPILLQDPDGVILDANAAACTLFARRRRDLLGRRIDELSVISREERSRLRVQLRRRGRGNARVRGLRPDGTGFPLLMHMAITALRGEERLLVQLRDATEQERMQGELLQAQKMEALGQLISGVAHELNNPLSAIVAFSQLLRTDPRLPDELTRDADLLMHEADRTRRIVQNLLDFARQHPPERRPTDLEALVERTLELHAYALGAAGITVDRQLPAELPLVDVDPGQIQQVLLNLTLNAIQAIRSEGRGGMITVAADTLRDEGGRERVRLSISDDGPGVSADVQPHLFEPFFTTKAVGEGTGLGLSVSYGIIAAHSGRLWYEPTDRRGATFVLELPAGTRAADRAAGSALVPSISRPSATRRRQPGAAILAVDDEPSVGEVVKRALGRDGHRVTLASSGDEALEKLRAEHFDVLLVDHRMSGMDGIELYRRAVEMRPELRHRAVIMSGDVLNAALRSFASDSSVRMLAKPFDVPSLVGAIDEILAAGQPGGAQPAAARSRG